MFCVLVGCPLPLAAGHTKTQPAGHNEGSHTMKMPVLAALLSSAILGLGGCASSQVDPSQYSGFLKDYSRLTPAQSATGAPVMRWIDPDVKLSTYRQVYIEPSQ